MRLIYSILFSCILSIAMGQPKPVADSLPLFWIGEEVVMTEEFIYTYRKNHQNPQDYTPEKITEYLELYINFKLKVAEARKRGLDTTAKFTTEFNTYREELKKPYRAEPNALDQLTQETYKRLTEEIRAAHILITVKPDALPADTAVAYQKIMHIKGRIDAGESFEKLARELSEDPSAKYNGGDLGYFTALQMVYPFEDAAYKTAVGSISPVTRTRFGYHLILVKDRKPSRGEVEVSHILLRTGTPQDDRVKSTIFAVYDQLTGGRNWEEVCREYSEDLNTKENGGRLKPFGVGALSSVPEFETMAFSLQNAGEISDPFQSAIGWHIIRLEKKIPLPPFSEMEPALKRRVSRDERLQLSQQSVSAQRKKKFGFQEYADVKAEVLALADSNVVQGKWKYSGSESLKSKAIVTILSTPYPVGDLIRYVQTNQRVSNLTPTAAFAQLYDGWVEAKISDAEEEQLKRDNPDFKNLLNEYREGILLFEVMEQEVWSKASQDTTGQRLFYDKNKNQYQAGDRVEARIFSTADKNVLNEIQQKISRGDTLKESDLKKFKSIQHARIYGKGESKIIDRVSWSAGVHEVEADGLYYLVEIIRLIAPGIKSFAEARPQVISDYQDYLEKAWVEKLRNDYRVRINKKGKKIVLTQLTQK